jgi:hypothetical protein
VQWVWSVALYYVEGCWNDDLLDLGRESVTQQLQDQRIRRAALQDQQKALLDQGNKLPALKRKIYYICYEELYKLGKRQKRKIEGRNEKRT